MSRRANRLRAGALALLALVAPAACAQDFPGAGPAAADDPFALLEHVLPAPAVDPVIAASGTRWWGLEELETSALALAAGVRALRFAAGVSQTGSPEVGWTSLALAVGGAGPGAGAAGRTALRLDREAPWSAGRAFGPAAGGVLGAGAWLEPSPGVRVWASAPQVVAWGAAPPLERPLEVGTRFGRASGVWLALRAPRAADDGERALGVCLVVPPLEAWAEVRDAPFRGAVGVRASAGPLRVGARADAHPVLGETLRATLEWRARRGRAR